MRVTVCHRHDAGNDADSRSAYEAWFDPMLSDDEQAKIAAAKREAVSELRLAQHRVESDSWLGTPNAKTAVALVDALTRA